MKVILRLMRNGMRKGVGIASEQGSGIGDDGEYDYQHLRNVRTLLLNFTYALLMNSMMEARAAEIAPGSHHPR